MKDLTLQDVLHITGGRLLGSFDDLATAIPGVVQDTRIEIDKPYMFIPYKGNNADGYDFILEAFDKGCIGCLTEKTFPSYRTDRFYVLVDNVLGAVWKLVAVRRKEIRARMICVTGSVGKTTTTGMIANVLRQKYNVFETEENWNDEFLAPGMIFKITDDHDFAVIELGMGKNSSVRKMAKILRPDVMVITNIGYAHIEKTGSLLATRDEKCGTEEGLGPEGFVVANGDDEMLTSYHFSHPVLTYGRNASNLVTADTRNYVIGPKHLEYASLAAIAVGEQHGLLNAEIQRGLRTYRQTEGRMDIVEKSKFVLIDSSFNASIESMKMALDVLGSQKMMRVAVLGEMLETGNYATMLHKELGKIVAEHKIDMLVAIGSHANDVVDEAKRMEPSLRASAADDIEAAKEMIADIFKASLRPAILCKGSHGSGVYRIADWLKGMEG